MRRFRRDDIPAVVALRQDAFRFSERGTTAALVEYLERLFCDSPWLDEELPSLVYVDGRGRVVGFIGVIPRRLVFQGEPIRTAVATQLMVAPESRGLAGRRLLRAVLEGPQELTLSDAANDAVRRLWESVGGRTSLAYSLSWSRALRPLRSAVARVARGPLLRVASFAVRPLLAVGDALAARFTGSTRPPPAGTVERLDPTTVVACVSAVLDGVALRPSYEDGSFAWLLGQLAEKRQFGVLEQAVVRGAAGEVAGWFLYLLNRGGAAEVVQIASHPGAQALVLGHLFHHARERGAVLMAGRLEPSLLPGLVASGCRLRRAGPWMLVRSRRPEIARAVERGDAFLSRLEGEWWLSF